MGPREDEASQKAGSLTAASPPAPPGPPGWASAAGLPVQGPGR